MKQKVCYRLDELSKMLPDFKLEAFKVIHDSEDETISTTEYRFARRTDIKVIKVYYGWGASITVEYNDGTKLDLYGDNITIKGRELLRINSNTEISPRVHLGGNYVESRENLVKWLKYNGISDAQLESIAETSTVYEVIEYVGVPTPTKSKNSQYWGYSNENLKLNEQEIITVLNSIEDETLREKIKCILYARVFKKRY